VDGRWSAGSAYCARFARPRRGQPSSAGALSWSPRAR